MFSYRVGLYLREREKNRKERGREEEREREREREREKREGVKGERKRGCTKFSFELFSCWQPFKASKPCMCSGQTHL